MTEQVLQKKIINYLESEGAYVVKVISASKAGVPDLIACYQGLFLGIEVKVGKNKTSKIQDYNLAKIKKALGITLVPYTLEEVKEALRFIRVQSTQKGSK